MLTKVIAYFCFSNRGEGVLEWKALYLMVKIVVCLFVYLGLEYSNHSIMAAADSAVVLLDLNVQWN